MGVDIQTYRGRIGTFKSSFGLDVVTIQCLVNFSHALKTIGRCIFIGLLLLMAGIESNPGPIIKGVKNKHADEDIKFNKKSVEVKPVYMNIIRIQGLDISQRLENPREFLEFLERETDGEKADHISVCKEDNCLFVIFKTEAGAKRLVQRSPLTFQKYSLEVQYVYDKDIHSVANSFPDSQLETGIKTEPKTNEVRRSVFKNLLQKCGLEDRYNNKITIQDVVAVSIDIEEERRSTYNDLPWFLLRNLIHVNSDARDKTEVTNVPRNEKCDEESTLSNISSDWSDLDDDDDYDDDNDDNGKETDYVSPIDIFHVVFQCSDPMLQQLLFQKLYLCKLAVPFIYTNDIGSPVTAVWPLRSLKVQNIQEKIKSQFSNIEAEILDLDTGVVSFARVGRPNFSKSKLLNGLLSENENYVFFNRESNKGNVPRVLSDGTVEMFWLPRVEGRENKFDSMVTFLNCRGDIRLFSCNVLDFVSHITDCMVIVVDIKTLCQDKTDIENLLEKFASKRVIFLIVDPIIQEYKEHLKLLRSEWQKKQIRIVPTHAKSSIKNVFEIVLEVSAKLKSQLTPFEATPLECRILNAKQLKTDEEDTDCQDGKAEAERIFSSLHIPDGTQSLEEVNTPVQYFFSKDMGNNMKKLQRAKKLHDREKCIKDILEVRQKQLKHVSKFVQDFSHCISNSEYSKLKLFFFLGWLKLFLETKKQNPPFSKSLTGKIMIETFKLEHIFREMGYLYDTLIALNENHKDYLLPSPEDVAMAVSKLLVHGFSLELIDGESFYFPLDWMRCVLASVSKTTGQSKCLSLSVLGVQSSGKSTLLNTMFGSQFSASAGRCTRGIHIQFIPVCSQLQSSKSKFDFVLILDTEGLRAPELYNGKYEHDNELATVITGIGDVTVINIMGENSGEIHEILQVVVRAFLRLKMANDKIDIRKCCYFVHQNVIDSAAREKKEEGLRKLTQSLDITTKEAAELEDIEDLEKFNQIIEFDITSNVWYFPNLWQGSIPMAHVNKEYSKSVCAFRTDLLKNALVVKNKPYKSISDIAIQITELWKGVLNEDFLFSFRSNIDFKAFVKLSEEVERFEFDLESTMYQTSIKLCHKKFTGNNTEIFVIGLKEINTELTELMNDKKKNIFVELESFFETNEYKEIICVWKSGTFDRFTIFCDQLLDRIKLESHKIYEHKKVDMWIREVDTNLKQQLMITSFKLTENGEVPSGEKIVTTFSEIWESCSKPVISKLFTHEDISLTDIFRNCLDETFRNNLPLLQAHLKKQNLTPLDTTLKDSFHESCINGKSDIHRTKLCVFRGVDKFKSGPFEEHVKQFFENIDLLLEQYCNVETDIAEHTVKQFLKEVNERLVKFKSEQAFKFSCDKTFSVKIFVHVTRRAIFLFEKRNQSSMEEKESRLSKHKDLAKKFFESYLKDREMEKGSAHEFANVIIELINDVVKSNLPHEVAVGLRDSNLPKSKGLVLEQVMKDLVLKDDFNCFIEYINSPNMFVEKWLNNKIESKVHGDYEMKSDMYYKQACKLTENYMKNFKSAISVSSVESVDTWIADFSKNVQFTTITDEDLHIIRMMLSNQGVNLRYFTKNILDILPDIENRIKMQFAHQSKNKVKWQGKNPIKDFVEKARGCLEQCPYCAEPCSLKHGHACKHSCLRHKPRGCRGIKKLGGHQFVLSNCCLDVLSPKKHICDIFGFKCNKKGERKHCRQEFHLYAHYQKYFPDWDIRSTSDIDEEIKVWKWFIAKYKKELSSAYDMNMDNVPQSWFHLTAEDALQSLSNQG